MDFFSILVIAIGLAMDAFAVSVASGVTIRQMHLRQTVTIALSFGLFQGIMPIIGWFAGVGFRDYITPFDHWLAFALLVAIGAKMIYESFQLEDDKCDEFCMTGGRLLILSIATSIDALAVGLSFSLLQVNILTPALIIGVVTFVLSYLGIILGRKVGHLFEGKIEIAGGIILILIGFKILLENTIFVAG
ncbi:MAG: manganese efflux pump [Desulfobulbaceae bacterium]|nr:MAG: manganese efflux pump [Desulfobulbaceae bacterium]